MVASTDSHAHRRSRQVSTDIVTRWLNLPDTTVHDVVMSNGGPDLIVRRDPAILTCSNCGQRVFDRYDRTVQRIRDLNVFEASTYLVVEKWRLKCPNCGVRVEDVGFAAPYARYTRRFEDLVARLWGDMPPSDVASPPGLGWE